jgi:hypothetical protein
MPTSTSSSNRLCALLSRTVAMKILGLTFADLSRRDYQAGPIPTTI